MRVVVAEADIRITAALTECGVLAVALMEMALEMLRTLLQILEAAVVVVDTLAVLFIRVVLAVRVLSLLGTGLVKEVLYDIIW